MVFVFLEGYAAGAPSYTTCADANLGGHGGNSSADVRVRDRRPPPGEARQPALVDDPGAPVRDCTRGWWLARDLHGGPHPLGRGALGSAHAGNQPDPVPHECEIHAARLRRLAGTGRGVFGPIRRVRQRQARTMNRPILITTAGFDRGPTNG